MRSTLNSTIQEMEAQARVVALWHDREWPSPDGTLAELPRIAMKMMEEFGELNGALVKHLQGRTDKDWLAHAHQEFGDVMVTMFMIHDRMRQLEIESDTARVHKFMERFDDRFYGPPGTTGQGVRDRRGANYRK